MALDQGSNREYDAGQPGVLEIAGDISPALLGFRPTGNGQVGAGYAVIDRPSIQPLMLNYGTQAAPVGVPTLPVAGDAQDTVTVIHFDNGPFHVPIQLYQATAQALKPLLHATKGIEIALDQVNNETVEYVPGGNSASNRFGYNAGVDPGVFIRATLEITTNNGIDQLMVGFRKQENYQVPGATFNFNGQAPGYTDFYGIGFAAAVASPNLVRVATTVGAANCITNSTAFGVTSGMIVRLEVRISGRKASAFINGVKVGDTVRKDGTGTAITAQPTTAVPDYTFTSGLFLIPWIFIRQDAGLSTVFLRRLELGGLGQLGGSGAAVFRPGHDAA